MTGFIGVSVAVRGAKICGAMSTLAMSQQFVYGPILSHAIKRKSEKIARCCFKKLVYRSMLGMGDQTKLSVTYTRGRLPVPSIQACWDLL